MYISKKYKIALLLLSVLMAVIYFLPVGFYSHDSKYGPIYFMENGVEDGYYYAAWEMFGIIPTLIASAIMVILVVVGNIMFSVKNNAIAAKIAMPVILVYILFVFVKSIGYIRMVWHTEYTYGPTYLALIVPILLVAAFIVCIVGDKQRINEKEVKQVKVINAQASTSADELAKYKSLLDSGVITKEEFEAKKKQLLGL